MGEGSAAAPAAGLATADDNGDSPLARAITPTLLLLFIVGDILGGGIYALVGEVGAETGGAIWAAFVLALVTQIEGEVFARAGILVGIGVALWLVNELILRRSA